MAPAQGHVLEWDTNKVVAWMELCGFGEFSAAFEGNRITGDVLVELDRDTLKDMGIRSIGRRLMLLKAIQGLRQQHGMMPDLDDATLRTPSPVHNEYGYYPTAFVSVSTPPLSGNDQNWSRRALYDRDLLIQKLAHELERLPTERQTGAEAEQATALSAPPLRTPSMSPTVYSPRKDSIAARFGDADGVGGSALTGPRSARQVRRTRMPSDAQEYQQPSAAPLAGGRPRFQSTPITPSRSDAFELSAAAASTSPGGSSPGRRVDQEGKQSFRIGREDRCAEVLPAVLKKYQIDDDWRTYALYISYGPNQRHERFVEYEEKVYPIMRSLKGDNPVVVLKKTDGETHKTIRRLHH